MYKMCLRISASPGKQVTLPQSLTTTTTIAGISNSGTATATASSITNEMNKSPNNTLRAVASPSAGSVNASKNTEKVYSHATVFISFVQMNNYNNFKL